MNLEDKLEQLPPNEVFGTVIQHATNLFGRGAEGATIRYFINQRSDYRKNHAPPDIRDDEANKRYKQALNLYAAK